MRKKHSLLIVAGTRREGVVVSFDRKMDDREHVAHTCLNVCDGCRGAPIHRLFTALTYIERGKMSQTDREGNINILQNLYISALQSRLIHILAVLRVILFLSTYSPVQSPKSPAINISHRQHSTLGTSDYISINYSRSLASPALALFISSLSDSRFHV